MVGNETVQYTQLVYRMEVQIFEYTIRQVLHKCLANLVKILFIKLKNEPIDFCLTNMVAYK